MPPQTFSLSQKNRMDSSADADVSKSTHPIILNRIKDIILFCIGFKNHEASPLHKQSLIGPCVVLSDDTSSFWPTPDESNVLVSKREG